MRWGKEKLSSQVGFLSQKHFSEKHIASRLKKFEKVQEESFAVCLCKKQNLHLQPFVIHIIPSQHVSAFIHINQQSLPVEHKRGRVRMPTASAFSLHISDFKKKGSCGYLKWTLCDFIPPKIPQSAAHNQSLLAVLVPFCSIVLKQKYIWEKNEREQK